MISKYIFLVYNQATNNQFEYATISYNEDGARDLAQKELPGIEILELLNIEPVK